MLKPLMLLNKLFNNGYLLTKETIFVLHLINYSLNQRSQTFNDNTLFFF